jgi:hypothetical protein
MPISIQAHRHNRPLLTTIRLEMNDMTRTTLHNPETERSSGCLTPYRGVSISPLGREDRSFEQFGSRNHLNFAWLVIVI